MPQFAGTGAVEIGRHGESGDASRVVRDSGAVLALWAWALGSMPAGEWKMEEAERAQLFAISMQEQMARLSWTGAEFDEARTIGLRSLLATARARSSWHAERLAGLDLERVGVADLAGLPVMTKADLMGSFDRIVTAPGLSLARLEDHVSRAGSDVELVDGEYLVLASGGSSGRRAVFPFTVPEAATSFASLLRFSVQWRSRQDLDLGVIATVTAGTSTHATAAWTRMFPRPEERHAFPITTPLEEIVEGLNRVQPALLVAYPSALSILAAEQVAGRLRISPAHLIATSEPLTGEARALAVRAWGLEPENFFGSTEGLMGWAAPGDENLTFNDDHVIVEPVDAHGHPVGPGETAQRLLITNLFNHTLPLIRYELTDELTVAPRGDWPFFRATKIEGRADDVFRYGAIAVHPLVFRSPLGRCPAVVEYQVRQTLRGADVSLLVNDGVDIATSELAATLTTALHGAGLDDPHVNITTVDELDRHPVTGKLRRFIPN